MDYATKLFVGQYYFLIETMSTVIGPHAYPPNNSTVDSRTIQLSTVWVHLYADCFQ